MKHYNIDYTTKTIELTKKFAKAAGVLNSPEYKEMVLLRKDFPDFEIAVREIKRKAGKKTYKNLTIDRMRAFIIEWEGEESEAKETFEKVVAISKVQAGPYAYVKAWFIKNYADRLEEYTPKNEEDAA